MQRLALLANAHWAQAHSHGKACDCPTGNRETTKISLFEDSLKSEPACQNVTHSNTGKNWWFDIYRTANIVLLYQVGSVDGDGSWKVRRNVSLAGPHISISSAARPHVLPRLRFSRTVFFIKSLLLLSGLLLLADLASSRATTQHHYS